MEDLLLDLNVSMVLSRDSTTKAALIAAARDRASMRTSGVRRLRTVGGGRKAPFRTAWIQGGNVAPRNSLAQSRALYAAALGCPLPDGSAPELASSAAGLDTWSGIGLFGAAGLARQVWPRPHAVR